MKENGWIKLYRNIKDWEWYDDANTIRLFIHILIKANHKENKWRGMIIERGAFITSYSNLSDDLSGKRGKITVQQIRTSLNKLKSTHEITIKTTNKFSLIKINNWDKFQEDNTQANTQITNKQQTNNKQITNKQQTNNKQITTNKNDKNEKNDKNIYNISAERQNNINFSWQLLAMDIINGLKNSNSKRASIFKCCKDDERRANLAWAECKDLNKLDVLYFLKVYNNLKTKN